MGKTDKDMPSWDELSRLATAAKAATGAVGRRGSQNQTEGPTCSQALLRTFGSSSEPRVVLYRDTHAWCPYCHKVWMQLEHKQVPYKVVKINMNCYGAKAKSFLKLTPRGLLPAIEIDGEFFTESSRIMQLIEQRFPERPMVPPGGQARQMSEQLLQLERGLFGAWLNWLRGDESAAARRDFEEALDTVDGVLSASDGDFFLGNEIQLVDCVFASSLERIAASILYYKGLQVKGGRWVAINAYFQALEADSVYRGTMSDFHTHVHDLPPQIGGCIPSGTPEQKQAAAMIDGTAGSWSLPLEPLLGSLESSDAEQPVNDRAEAAAALIHCHDGCVRSSMAGTRASAALQGQVDHAFLSVAHALLSGPDEVQGAVDSESASAVANCLRYTRDRICVPRDMSFPAARQLRAHLNWLADELHPRPNGRWCGIPIAMNKRADVDPAVFHGGSFL